tara:strand:+ start:879 stop:1265 length:387 start_codon:yes stop_codon:yes gene_type:complete
MLQDNHQRALALLVSGHNMTDTAKMLGVRRETVWRWTKEPEFATQMARVRESAMDALEVVLHESAIEAAEVLRSVMKDEGASPSTRIRAAVAILERVQKAQDIKAKREAQEPPTMDLEEWVNGEQVNG